MLDISLHKDGLTIKSSHFTLKLSPRQVNELQKFLNDNDMDVWLKPENTNFGVGYQTKDSDDNYLEFDW